MIGVLVFSPILTKVSNCPEQLSRQSRNVPLAGKVETSPFAWSCWEPVIFCDRRWSGDGQCWRATRSRNSRPELICGRWEGAWSSRHVPLPGLGADQREVVGPEPGFGSGVGFGTPSDQI